MPKCIIDGRETEFAPGENLVEVAKRAGINIPVFCYHPGLSVVAQCRMCAVEIEKMPKLQTACSTAATEGMVVKTQSDRAVKNQKSIMEFLLINHPLDCPICDKAGECDLQDQSYDYGSPYSRMTEERRAYIDLDMGPVIVKNMNRCIHCTRCIRFGEQVAGIHEMVALRRGNDTEITTVNGKPLQTEYAGNYSDICPTGSLTLKDFRFKKRVWLLKRTPTVCEGCARGCAMEVHAENGIVYRCVARENLEVNKYWLCDEGRFNFHYLHETDRLTEPAVASASGLVTADWKSAIEKAKAALQGRKCVALIGSDLTQEEASDIQQFINKAFNGIPLLHFGTPGIRSAKDDADADKILKRKSKTSNLHGFEKLGLKGFENIPAGTEGILIFRGGRAVIPALPELATVGIGVFKKAEAEKYSAVLPGAAFAEKSGTIVNFQSREQKLVRAILPPGKSKDISEILMIWSHA